MCGFGSHGERKAGCGGIRRRPKLRGGRSQNAREPQGSRAAIEERASGGISPVRGLEARRAGGRRGLRQEPGAQKPRKPRSSSGTTRRQSWIHRSTQLEEAEPRGGSGEGGQEPCRRGAGVSKTQETTGVKGQQSLGVAEVERQRDPGGERSRHPAGAWHRAGA